jgi:hypothetical protein
VYRDVSVPFVYWMVLENSSMNIVILEQNLSWWPLIPLHMQYHLLDISGGSNITVVSRCHVNYELLKLKRPWTVE